MEADDERQRRQDEEHLKLLSIFYYVAGSLSALIALFPLMYGAFGLAMMAAGGVASPRPGPEAVVPAMLGGCFAFAGGMLFLLGGTLAAVKFYAGYCLSRHRSRTFCLVVAGLTCLAIPYGTVLGVFTFVVLARPSVEELFAPEARPSY